MPPPAKSDYAIIDLESSNTSKRRSRTEEVAQIISSTLHPVLVWVGGLFAVAVATMRFPRSVVVPCGVSIVLFTAVVVALRPFRLGRQLILSVTMSRTERMMPPFLIPLLCGLLTAIIVAVGLGASRPLTVYCVLAPILVGIGAAFNVGFDLRVSAHTTAITTAVLVAVILLGARALPSLLLIPIVIWARLTLKVHSVAEITFGLAVGTFAAICIMSAGLV